MEELTHIKITINFYDSLFDRKCRDRSIYISVPENKVSKVNYKQIVNELTAIVKEFNNA